jgi:uncharacterized protein (TIGR01244 family)
VKRTLIAVLVVVASIGAAAQQVTKETVEGVRNFSRLETTIACAGATTPGAVAEIKRMGYASVINLRPASEAGAEVEAEAAAAKAAGITYIHLPYNSSDPAPDLVDNFLAAITNPANQPAFVHCASGNRAAALWMIKRMAVDGWDENRAGEEATALGLTSPALRTFAVEQAQARKR